jgi:hypothetical protein
MEFAGKEYIYLSKLKKDKIRQIKNAEKDNKGEAPGIIEDKKEDQKEEDKKEVIKEEVDEYIKEEDPISQKLEKYSGKKRKNANMSNDSPNSEEAISVNSANFDKDLEMSDSLSEDEEAAPMGFKKKKGQVFKKELDTNVCVVHYNELENEPNNIVYKSYQCKKCQAYLNKYSNLVESEEKNKYEWKCEFCSELNKDLIINIKDIPKTECIDKCIEPPIEIEKKTKDGNDSSLIFCFDISGSMCQSYNVGRELKEKFNKISGQKKKNKKKFLLEDDDDDLDFDFNQENTSYISRLDLVKLSIENNINTLLKTSPDLKVGIVSFGSNIEVKGDCLSNIMVIKEKDMNDEEKIKSLGEENTNLIKAPIKQSSSKILEALKATEENGSTALGPAVLLSLSLLKNAKIGSRIFLCTDGMSNLGVGDISENRDKASLYYTKIGEMAKSKGIVINLITFEDSESEIDILMKMVQNSGGEIIRVNPNAILDGFNDLLENEAIASEVNIKMNLNKCMTFRDEEDKDMSNDGSTIDKKLGNVTKETETYYELKFKKAIKLAEMNDINFDELKNLIFQCEIIYKKKNGGKYVRVISKNLKVSDNKDEVEKVADFEIISTMEIQKTAKLASQGLYREAQAQAHVTRKYLAMNKKSNESGGYTHKLFNQNMNCFNIDLGKMHNEKMKISSMPLKFKKKEEEDNNVFNNDHFTGQIYSLSHTSQNRQKNLYKRNKK